MTASVTLNSCSRTAAAYPAIYESSAAVTGPIDTHSTRPKAVAARYTEAVRKRRIIHGRKPSRTTLEMEVQADRNHMGVVLVFLIDDIFIVGLQFLQPDIAIRAVDGPMVTQHPLEAPAC